MPDMCLCGRHCGANEKVMRSQKILLHTNTASQNSRLLAFHRIEELCGANEKVMRQRKNPLHATSSQNSRLLAFHRTEGHCGANEKVRRQQILGAFLRHVSPMFILWSVLQKTAKRCDYYLIPYIYPTSEERHLDDVGLFWKAAKASQKYCM
ncbi:hypothetical protein M378DRAFT_167596, partial [Amanita muscaria Koide BX008]